MKNYIKFCFVLVISIIVILILKNISYAKYAIIKNLNAVKITIHIEQEESGE